MSPTNRQVRLAARPSGLPQTSDWDVTEEPLPTPGAGELAVAISHVSLDPAMRGWMNAGASYIDPVEIGDVMRAGAVGRVIASEHPGFAVGEHVYSDFGVQEYALSDGRGVVKVDPALAPLPTYLGTLGMTGMTAYFGLFDVAKLQEGETVVVSGAAGAVGGLVGQIAKLKDCRTVGIAGGPEKCSHLLEDLGFDATIDYKSEDLNAALAEHCPKGIDIYFDNVGGDILDAALAHLARHARVVICGAISQYNNTTALQGPANYLSLLVNHASMTGFVMSDYLDRYGEAVQEMAGWLASGKLVSREDIAHGLENFPDTLLRLFHGENTGKLVLEV